MVISIVSLPAGLGHSTWAAAVPGTQLREASFVSTDTVRASPATHASNTCLSFAFCESSAVGLPSFPFATSCESALRSMAHTLPFTFALSRVCCLMAAAKLVKPTDSEPSSAVDNDTMVVPLLNPEIANATLLLVFSMVTVEVVEPALPSAAMLGSCTIRQPVASSTQITGFASAFSGVAPAGVPP